MIAQEPTHPPRPSPLESRTPPWTYLQLPPRRIAKLLFARFRYPPPGPVREGLELRLRDLVVPGDIDVNIMTKLDRRTSRRGDERPSQV